MMDKNEQLKMIALLAVIGLGECVELGGYDSHPELLQELSDVTDMLDNTATKMDDLLRENQVEILQVVINYIKGLQ